MTQACAFLISFSGFLMQVVRGHILKRKNTSRRMLLEVLLGLGLLLHHHLSLRHARPRFQIHVPPKYNGPASSSLLQRFSRQERSPQSQPFLSKSCSSLKVKFIGHNLLKPHQIRTELGNVSALPSCCAMFSLGGYIRFSSWITSLQLPLRLSLSLVCYSGNNTCSPHVG